MRSMCRTLYTISAISWGLRYTTLLSLRITPARISASARSSASASQSAALLAGVGGGVGAVRCGCGR